MGRRHYKTQIRANRYRIRKNTGYYNRTAGDERLMMYLLVFGLAPFTCGFSLAGLPALLWSEWKSSQDTAKLSTATTTSPRV